jgi:hypothetical protein
MYYVIKKQLDNSSETFMWFKSPKFIASKESANVIFEFSTENKLVRKWVKKDEIILLTDDKEYFVQTLNTLKNLQNEQLKLIEDAHNHLARTLENFTQTMQNKFEEYTPIRNENDIPLIHKTL